MRTIDYDSAYTSEVLALWNTTMRVDPLSRRSFIEKMVLDPNFYPELCRICLDGTEVVGFIWATKRKVSYGDKGLEPDRAWIVGLCVKAACQNKGIGTRLLTEVETLFDTMQVKTITIGAYSPSYLYPGVDENHYAPAVNFFNKNGYTNYAAAVSMKMDLLTYHFSEEYLALKKQVLNQYQIEKLSIDSYEALINFLHQNFGGGWARNVQNAIAKGEADQSIIIIKDEKQQIVGYVQRGIEGQPSRFGPFGVSETLRGQKLGTVLFNEMMRDMQKSNIPMTYFLWTGGKAQRFYERNGMQVYRSYQLMKKTVEA